MIRADKLGKNLKDKVFLLLLKIIPHFLALFYAIYNILFFMDIDSIIFGHFIHVSLLPWIALLLMSFRFKYCYIHRIPLYYIAIIEIITDIDYYIGLPISTCNLLNLHIFLIAVIIFIYTYYYLKK